eukprot:15480164-Alexandrium_andersonii.AAC.1
MAAMKCRGTGGRKTPPEDSGPSPPSASVRRIVSFVQICRWKGKAEAFSSIALCANKFSPYHSK